MASGVITCAGVSALLAAQLAGQTFSPNVVQISSSVLACTGEETSLPSVVWTAPAAAVTQIALSNNTLRTIIYMDTTVGNFTIGTVGLFTSTGQLFALGTFPGAGTKTASNLPSVVGNIRTLYLDLIYTDISSTFVPEVSNLSVITLAEAFAAYSSRTVTASGIVTATIADGVILIDKTMPSTTTVLLPPASTATIPITVKDLAGNAASYPIVLSPNGTETIDGLSSRSITTDYGSVTLYPLPAGGWYVL